MLGNSRCQTPVAQYQPTHRYVPQYLEIATWPRWIVDHGQVDNILKTTCVHSERYIISKMKYLTDSQQPHSLVLIALLTACICLRLPWMHAMVVFHLQCPETLQFRNSASRTRRPASSEKMHESKCNPRGPRRYTTNNM